MISERSALLRATACSGSRPLEPHKLTALPDCEHIAVRHNSRAPWWVHNDTQSCRVLGVPETAQILSAAQSPELTTQVGDVMEHWLPTSVRRAIGEIENSRDRRPRPSWAELQTCRTTYEALKERVVPTGCGWGGASLIQSLSNIGVATGLGARGDRFRAAPEFAWHNERSPQSPQTSQPNTDIAKSHPDLQALHGDDQAIAASGAALDPQGLQTASSGIATAVVTGADTSQSKTDFAALFADSSATQDTINTAFSDVVQTVTDSNVRGTALTTIATDRANIQNELNALRRNQAESAIV